MLVPVGREGWRSPARQKGPSGSACPSHTPQAEAHFWNCTRETRTRGDAKRAPASPNPPAGLTPPRQVLLLRGTRSHCGLEESSVARSRKSNRKMETSSEEELWGGRVFNRLGESSERLS